MDKWIFPAFVSGVVGTVCGAFLISLSPNWHKGTPKIENCWQYKVVKGQPVISESHLKVYFGKHPAKLCLEVKNVDS